MTFRSSCPKCGDEHFIVDVVEVDIGVGIARYTRGGSCQKCGEFAVCDFCGSWTMNQNPEGDVVEFQPHVNGCLALEGARDA